MNGAMSADFQVPIYVAGASREAARVREWAWELERVKPFCLTSRWFLNAEQWAGKDRLLTREAQSVQADECRGAIRVARIFWLLWPQQHSYGVQYELGYASAHQWHAGKESLYTVVTGPGSGDTIFTADADYREEEDVLGWVEVTRVARQLLGEGAAS